MQALHALDSWTRAPWPPPFALLVATLAVDSVARVRLDIRTGEDDSDSGRSGLQIRRKTHASKRPVHQCPDPVIPGVPAKRRRNAFQGYGRSLADTRFRRCPVPVGAAQRSQATRWRRCSSRNDSAGPASRLSTVTGK